jgi:hypothetical protein
VLHFTQTTVGCWVTGSTLVTYCSQSAVGAAEATVAKAPAALKEVRVIG